MGATDSQSECILGKGSKAKQTKRTVANKHHRQLTVVGGKLHLNRTGCLVKRVVIQVAKTLCWGLDRGTADILINSSRMMMTNFRAKAQMADRDTAVALFSGAEILSIVSLLHRASDFATISNSIGCTCGVAGIYRTWPSYWHR